MGRFVKSALLSTAALGLALAATPAGAQDLGSLFVFGDSLADPGNLPPAFQPPAALGYSNGRFSNGPVIPEYLDSFLGVPTAVNRAVGGATSGQILGQVNAFIAAGGRVGADDITYLYGDGPNDYFAVLPVLAVTPAPAQPALIAATVAQVQSNISAQVTALAGVGARRFVLGTLPNFAGLPQFSAIPAVAAGAGALSTANNAALVTTANALSALGDVTLVDYAALLSAVQANPAAFGFTNGTQACIAVPSCRAGTQAQQNQFLFFDGVHPTTAGQAIAAAAAADAVQAPYQVAATVENEELVARAFGRDLMDSAGATFRTPEFRSADLPDAPMEESVVRYGAIEVTGGYRRIDFDRSSNAASAGFDSSTNRFSLAGAYDASGLRVGAMLAYDDIDVDAERTAGDIRAVRGGLFAGVVHGVSPFVNVYASAAVQAGLLDYDLARDTRIPGFTARGETDGWSMGLSGEARITRRILDTVEIGPIARLGFVEIDIDGYTETGAPAGVNRTYSDIADHYGYGEIGLALTHAASTGFGAVDVSLAALYHDGFGDDGTRIGSRASTLPGFVSSIEAGGDRGGEFRIEADIDLVTARGVSVGLDGDATFGDDVDGYGIGASVGYRF